MQQVLFLSRVAGRNPLFIYALMISPLYLSSPRYFLIDFFFFFNGVFCFFYHRFTPPRWENSSRLMVPPVQQGLISLFPPSWAALVFVLWLLQKPPLVGHILELIHELTWEYPKEKQKRKKESQRRLYLQRDNLTVSQHKTPFKACAEHILYFWEDFLPTLPLLWVKEASTWNRYGE